MSKVSWGGPTLQFIPVAAGQSAPAGSWAEVTGLVEIKADDLLEDSSTLNTTEGEVKELRNEFGVVVDRKQMPSSYQFTTSIIKKKGYTAKFTAVNGIVSGDWAMRLIAEDSATPGFEFPLCNILVAKGWSADQGALENLTVNAIEPNGIDKEMCKDYSVSPAQSGS